jgi:Tol biopolymer transport system component
MSSPGRLALAALAGAAVVGSAWLISGKPQPLTPPTQKVLSTSDHDWGPSASPEGHMIAFASDRDGQPKVWLKQLASDEEIPLTDGPDDLPRFSPAGSAILFVRTDMLGTRLLQVPVQGGVAKPVIDHASEGDWSPDGQRVAFVRLTIGTHATWRVGIASSSGTGTSLLSAPSDLPLACPRWSPDGKTIAVIQSRNQLAPDQLLLVDAATLKSTVRPLHSGLTVTSLAWSGDGRLLIAQSSNNTPVATARILLFDPASGTSEDLVYQPNLFGGIDVLGDGRLVVESRLERQNLREISYKESGAPGRWLSHGASIDRQPVYWPGSNWLAFSSSRNGNIDIWMVSTQTGAIRHVIDHAGQDADPGFTTDGQTLLWSSNRSGAFEIWAADAEGTDPHQITHDGVDAENPTASPDGWVTYNTNNAAHPGVWKIRRDGSQAQRLVAGATLRPEISPDGNYVLYSLMQAGERMDIHFARTSDGVVLPFSIILDPGPTAVPHGRVLGRARWAPDGHSIILLGLDGLQHLALLQQDFDPARDTSSSRRVLAVYDPKSFGESFCLSPDGMRITVALREEQSVLTMISGLRAVGRTRTAAP